MAAAYAFNIPAIPAVTSGAAEHPPPAVNPGTPLDGAHLDAARAFHDNRKRLARVNPPLATAEEVRASKRLKHAFESAHLNDAGPGVPQWGIQLQNNLQNSMQQLQNNMQNSMQQLLRRMDQESQRSINRSRRNTADPIVPVIRLVDGNLPDQAPHNLYFPADQNALDTTMTSTQTNHLLQFYEMPVHGNMQVRKARLKQHLGVTL